MAFGQFGDMVKQARELQNNLKKVKEELTRARYTGEAGGVKVLVNGEMEIMEVTAGPGTSPNNFKDAANKALKSARDDAADKLKKATGGINIPGLT